MNRLVCLAVRIQACEQLPRRADGHKLAAPGRLHRLDGFLVGDERLERQRLLLNDLDHHHAERIRHREAHGAQHVSGFILNFFVDAGTNNKDRNFTRASLTQFIKAADARLEDYLQRLDKSDGTESATGGSRVKNLAEKIAAIRQRRERHKDMLAELDQTGESQISLTDPDSRAMAAHTHVAVGYNVQIAVDAKHKLIVEQQVTNQVVDMGLLAQTAEPAKEVLGVERIAVVADRGYFKIEDIEACEKAGMEPYVPRPQRGPSVRAGLFRKDEFSYDSTSDSFLCPAGQRLHPYSSSLMRGLKKINYRNSQACRDCPIRPQCTGNQFRAVSRLENEAVLDRMQARIAQRPDILDQRRETVEHPFGTIKQWMNQGAFLMRGLEKVRAEFSLTALAYNLRRVLNIVGLPKLIAALPA